METFIRKAIEKVLRNHEDLLRIAVKQRAKFEHWLKFELACEMSKNDIECVEVESTYPSDITRADITFSNNGKIYSIELKTPNTSWMIKGVNSKKKLKSRNIESIIKDIGKMKDRNGIIAFVLFPVPMNDERWKRDINKIREETNIPIDIEKHCIEYNLGIDEFNECKLIICSFYI